MASKLPLSVVSYNSIPFAKARLDEMRDEGYIMDYYIFPHQADTDDKKDHRHILVIPNGQIDWSEFRKRMMELDFSNPLKKPLGCSVFETCNSIDDWILYVLHDEVYLEWKQRPRNIVNYPKELMICSDENLYEQQYYHAYNESEFARRNTKLRLLQDPKVRVTSLINNGYYSINQIRNLDFYRKLYFGEEYAKKAKEVEVEAPDPPELTDEQKRFLEIREKNNRIHAEKEKALREVFENMIQTKL